MAPSRRTLLLAGTTGAVGLAGCVGVAYGLIEAEVLPGRIRLETALGRCGSTPTPPPAGTPGSPEQVTTRTGRFRSTERACEVGWTLLAPRRHAPDLPLVVVLHGFGADHASAARDLALDRYLAGALRAGVPGFGLVAVDGGGTYWHRRANGDDPLGMITAELLPRMARNGLRTRRFGLLGYSMGGYGALLAAERLGPSRVAAVAALSPAIFDSYASARGANPTAFDGPADFARNDVLSGHGRRGLRGIPTRIACGDSDIFRDPTRRLRRTLGDPPGGIGPGCHDAAYWRGQLPDTYRFLGTHLRAAAA